jgi:hypothetical protein
MRVRHFLVSVVVLPAVVVLSGCAGCDGSGDVAVTGSGSPSSATDAEALRYAVTASVVSSSGSLGALQYEIRYLGGDGVFVGAAGAVECESAAQAQLASFNNAGDGFLKAALVDLKGFATPSPISVCQFATPGSLSAGDFSISIVDASPPGLEDLDTFPAMEITSVARVP